MSSIYKRPKSRFYWIKYRDADGNLRRESLDTPHKGVALARMKLIDSQVKRQQSGQYDPGIQELLKRRLNHVKANCSTNHYINAKTRLNAFIREEKITSADDITPSAVRSFLNRLQSRVSLATAHGYRVAISAWCQMLFEDGILMENPCRRIKLGRLQAPPPRWLDVIEYKRTLRLAIENGILLPVLVALKAGLRSEEIRLLRWEDVHFVQGVLLVRKTEGKRGRSVDLDPTLARRLQLVAHPSGPVFGGQRGGHMGDKQWKALFRPLKAASPKFDQYGKTLHLLRSTFASRYVQHGGDIFKLSRLLGHTSVETTRKSYAYLSPHQRDEIIRGGKV